MRRYRLEAQPVPAEGADNMIGEHSIRLSLQPSNGGATEFFNLSLEDAEALEGEIVAARETFRADDQLQRTAAAAGQVS